MEVELMFYVRCWRELRSFLADVVRDNSDECPYARDVLDLMKKIENNQR